MKQPFQTSSRINSTWGGNLIDMVRSTAVRSNGQEKLVENAERALITQGLNELEQKYSFISNIRAKVFCTHFH